MTIPRRISVCMCVSRRMLVYMHGKDLLFSRCFELYTEANLTADPVKMKL